MLLWPRDATIGIHSTPPVKFRLLTRIQVFDGVPSENLYGSDLRKDFMDVGYELFGDKETLKSTFIASDVFDDNSPLLKELAGKVNIVYTGSFFHLFDYDQQINVAKRVVQLLKPEKDSLVLGRQVGNVDAGEFARSGYHGEAKRFRHNEESWKEFLEKGGRRDGYKVGCPCHFG